MKFYCFYCGDAVHRCYYLPIGYYVVSPIDSFSFTAVTRVFSGLEAVSFVVRKLCD